MDLYQTIGDIFRPVSEDTIQQLNAQALRATQDAATVITIPIPVRSVEDVEYKEIKPTTLTADIYSEIAERIKEEMWEDESSRDYATCCFDISGFCPRSSDGNMEVSVSGYVSIRYFREEWGREGYIQSAHISSSRCQTWDDDGDDTDNDFSDETLIEYLKD